MTTELIYMRDDGDNGLELTSIHDKNAVAYVRADCTGNITIKEKRNLFVDGAERNEDMRYPCDTCQNHDRDEFDYPCGACMHG